MVQKPSVFCNFQNAASDRFVDERGYFQELLRADQKSFDNFELKQISIFTINPLIKRGDHYHKETVEIFTVLEGELYALIDDLTIFMVEGDTVRVLPGQRHSFVTDNSLAKVLVLSNHCFDRDNPDTYI